MPPQRVTQPLRGLVYDCMNALGVVKGFHAQALPSMLHGLHHSCTQTDSKCTRADSPTA